MRYFALSFVLLAACSDAAVIDADPSPGAGGGGVGGAGGNASTTSSGQGGGLGGFSGTGGAGGTMRQWENNCDDNTSVTIQIGNEAPVVLSEPCSIWGADHHAGPVAYDVLAGFYGSLGFEACDAQNGRELYMTISDDVGDPEAILGGHYDDGTTVRQIYGGSLMQTGGMGEIGEVIEGTITLTLNTSATGTIRVCRIPDLPLP
jgi:hypothetical protein